jgi:hypothetical protein
MTVTLSPQTDRRVEAFALTTLFLAAVACVIVFFPAEGRVLVPVHDGMNRLLGQTAFVIPLGLTLAATLGLVRKARPAAQLPVRRLVGLGVITIALVPSEQLLGRSTGLLGEWFAGVLLNVLGRPVTVALLLALVTVGVALTFNLKPSRLPLAAR